MDTETFGKLRDLPLKGITFFCKKRGIIRVKTLLWRWFEESVKVRVSVSIKKNVGIVITKMMGPEAGISEDGNYAFGKSFQL